MKPEHDAYLYTGHARFSSLKQGLTPVTLLHLLLIHLTCGKAALQQP